MAGSRVAPIALVALFTATTADAQALDFTGLFTAHVGIAATQDVRDPSMAAGVSLVVIDGTGYGAELDIGHTNDFDDRFAGDSSITSAMLSFTYVYPHTVLRPYLIAGAGVMRVRVEVLDNQPGVGRTEAGWTAGGGAHYMVNETFGIRGDARYLRHFKRHSDLPLSDGGALDFWRFSLGATLSWPIS